MLNFEAKLNNVKTQAAPIGVFDSGYGGLTVLKEIVRELPQYDYIYLGDNARAPYGSRSYETVHEYTLECVKHLFDKGCQLVIVACNTASAKALRTIQQKDLPLIDPARRVLGVIRPTTEVLNTYTKTGSVGVLGTAGTVNSQSYPLELAKFFPEIKVYQQACPMWVPLVENNEYNDPGADYFIHKYVDLLLAQSKDIDTIVLGCTHYPVLYDRIRAYLPANIHLLMQGPIVAASMKDYLQRHPEIEQLCSKGSQVSFFTTEYPENFDGPASVFFGKPVASEHLPL